MPALRLNDLRVLRRKQLSTSRWPGGAQRVDQSRQPDEFRYRVPPQRDTVMRRMFDTFASRSTSMRDGDRRTFQTQYSY